MSDYVVKSYTWYPDDWTSSDAVFSLSLCERGLYRELIDLAMRNNNSVQMNIPIWWRKFNSTVEEITETINKLELLNLIIVEDGYLRIPSCEKRLDKILFASENGKKGGAPKGNSNATKQLNNPKTSENQTQIQKQKQINKTKTKANTNKQEVDLDNQPIESLGSVETFGVSIDTQSPQGFLPKGYVDITDEVASKGYSKFLESFPENKRRHSDESLEIWNSLSQSDKQMLFKHLKSQLSKYKLEGKEQFFKNSENYLKAGEWKDMVQRNNTNKSKSLSGKYLNKPGMIDYNFYSFYHTQLGIFKTIEESMKDFKALPTKEQNEWEELYLDIQNERLTKLQQQTN